MGILHSTSRFFGRKTEEEEFPYLLQCNGGGDSPKTSSRCSSIFKAILQGFVWRRKATANPVLPIQNSSSSSSRNSDDERRSHRGGIVNVLYYQQQKKQRDDEVVRPIFTFPSSSIVAVPKYSQRNAPAVPATLIKSSSTIDVVSNEKFRKSLLLQTSNTNSGRSPQCGIVDEHRLQKKLVTPSSTIISERKLDAPRNAPVPVVVKEKFVLMKPADRQEEEKKVTLTKTSSIIINEKWIKKLVTPSSTIISVRKDAPRNVPAVKVGLGMKKPDPKEEKKVSLIKSIIINEKWIKHYSNRHRILLVGEGDFSFSASLALAFSSASNITATSLNSQEFLKKNYSKAASNIENLRMRQSKVMHEVDATKMANHPSLQHLKFDRIIFNFPYAGLALKKLPRELQLGIHRGLVEQFLKNAKEMLSANGEIHISHKTNGFHVEFNLVTTASSHRLRLIEAVKFNNLDYPGYNTKCGFGGDNNFDCNPSKTYKFALKNF